MRTTALVTLAILLAGTTALAGPPASVFVQSGDPSGPDWEAFAGQDPAADLEPDDVFDFLDVFALLIAFGGGCP
ncbi:MAG: hypothetical protein R3B57_08880 [Phycisphaerales bacterium]